MNSKKSWIKPMASQFIHPVTLITPLAGLVGGQIQVQAMPPVAPITTASFHESAHFNLSNQTRLTQITSDSLLTPSPNSTTRASTSLKQATLTTNLPNSGVSQQANDLLPRPLPSDSLAQAQPVPASQPTSDQPEKQAGADNNLAQAAQNPIASLISVPFQSNWNFGVGPENGTQYVLNVQPVIPLNLGTDWQVVTRWIVPVIAQPDLGPGLGPVSGLGDINPSFFFVPKNTGDLTIGFGPTFVLPTGTSVLTGQGKWSIGPTGVIVLTKGKWVLGALANQIWSFAGESDRQSVSQFLVQPFVNYNLPDGWYLTTAPVIIANWQADSGNQWTVPLGGGVGKLFNVGNQPVNASLQAYGYVTRPEGGPDWLLRFQVQLLFPAQ